MRSRILVLLSLWCSLSGLALASANAQSADEFFHGGAQSYITNNVANARSLVDAGLQLYPEDEKLKKLDALLKQQQQQQNQDQNQQNQNQQDQQNQDQKNQQNKNQQNQNKNQQGKNDQQKQDSQKQDQQDKQDQEKNQQQSKNERDQQKQSEEKKEQQGQQTEVKAQPMTAEQAQKLLDGEKGDEKVLVFQPMGKEKPENPDHPHKDW